jgi:hypothetical protein
MPWASNRRTIKLHQSKKKSSKERTLGHCAATYAYSRVCIISAFYKIYCFMHGTARSRVLLMRPRACRAYCFAKWSILLVCTRLIRVDSRWFTRASPRRYCRTELSAEHNMDPPPSTGNFPATCFLRILDAVAVIHVQGAVGTRNWEIKQKMMTRITK